MLMSNHVHILVRVPEKEAADAGVTDAELIRRVGRLNGEKAAAVLAGMQPEVLREAAMKLDGHPLNPAADGTVVERWEKRRAQVLRGSETGMAWRDWFILVLMSSCFTER
jgi:hypothetical protein